MEKNVGGADRITRFVVGSSLLAYGLRSKGWKRWLAMALGSNLVGTASAQRCAVNRAMGINTAEAEAKKKANAMVDEASEESFPASDPPAYTVGSAR